MRSESPAVPAPKQPGGKTAAAVRKGSTPGWWPAFRLTKILRRERKVIRRDRGARRLPGGSRREGGNRAQRQRHAVGEQIDRAALAAGRAVVRMKPVMQLRADRGDRQAQYQQGTARGEKSPKEGGKHEQAGRRHGAQRASGVRFVK